LAQGSTWLSGVALGAAIVYSFWGTIGKPDCQDFDFGSYYRAALAVRQGESPYTVDEHGILGVYPYAPAYAYLLIPLSSLDYLWACRLWMLLNWGLTGLVSSVASNYIGIGFTIALPLRWTTVLPHEHRGRANDSARISDHPFFRATRNTPKYFALV
jgi:hypothetical protein